LAVVDWVKQETEKVKNKNRRDHNSVAENELMDMARDRWSVATERKVDFEGQSLNAKWRRFEQIYRNKQWAGESVSPNKSTPVLNLTLAMIQAVLPRITDTSPEFLIYARRGVHHGAFADMLTSIMRYLWYHNKMQERQMSEAILHALKYGTSILKIIWDPRVWNGEGEVQYNVVHPMNFFPDPRAYDIESMDYCFTAVPKSLEYFIRRWPSKGHLVVPDQDWVETEALEGRDQPSKEKTATLKEYWYKDQNGTVCVMYFAGHVVLDVIGGELDKNVADDYPVYKHNKFPFAKIVDYPGDKEFWGFGEIELAEILQRLINNFESQIIDNTRLMGNAQWVVNKLLSGLKEEDSWIFDNAPGRVIFTHNDGVRKEPGTPIPPHIPEHLDRLIMLLEQILGIHDLVQGRRPAGVRAASAIIALQEAANIRVKEKTNRLGDALRDLVEQSIYLVMEYYDEPRQIRMAGDTAPATINVDEALEQELAETAMEAGELQFDEEMGPPEMIEGQMPTGPEGMGRVPEEERQRLRREASFPDFDIEIKIGPSLPYSQALLYEQSKEFYQLGIIDRQAVLESTNFPDRERILERMAQMEAEAAATAEEEEGGEERIGERI